MIITYKDEHKEEQYDYHFVNNYLEEQYYYHKEEQYDYHL